MKKFILPQFKIIFIGFIVNLFLIHPVKIEDYPGGTIILPETAEAYLLLWLHAHHAIAYTKLSGLEWIPKFLII